MANKKAPQKKKLPADPEILPPKAPRDKTRNTKYIKEHRGVSQFTERAEIQVTRNLEKAREGYALWQARKRAAEAEAEKHNPIARLSYQELLFCHELMAEGVKMNYSAAARRAGLKGMNSGIQQMQKPHVRAYVEILQRQRLNKLQITADRVLGEIAKVAFADMINYVNIGADGAARVDLSGVVGHPDRSAAMQEISVEEVQEKTGENGPDGEPTWHTVRKVRFKLGEKMKALELLGKNLTLFTDSIRLGDTEGNPLPAPVFKIEFVDPEPEVKKDGAEK